MTTTAAKPQPSAANLPLTEGQRLVQERDAQADQLREREVSERHKDQVDDGKVTGKEATAAKELQDLSQRDPAAARAAGAAGWFDQFSARNGEEALQGHFATVTGGEHAGRYGVFEEIATFDDDNHPVTVVLRTRDERNDRLVVNFDDLQRAEPGRR